MFSLKQPKRLHNAVVDVSHVHEVNRCATVAQESQASTPLRQKNKALVGIAVQTFQNQMHYLECHSRTEAKVNFFLWIWGFILS